MQHRDRGGSEKRHYPVETDKIKQGMSYKNERKAGKLGQDKQNLRQPKGEKKLKKGNFKKLI